MSWPRVAFQSPSRAERLIRSQLVRLAVGSLDLTGPDGQCKRYGTGVPHASIQVQDADVFASILKGGDIGLADTYLDGQWSTPDLVALLELLARNRQVLGRVLYGHWFGTAVARLYNLLRRNTRSGSKRNIAAHYDLGNAFYALWLDETWTYSSAIFADPTEPLAHAQRRKLDRALDAAQVKAGSRVLEIGCGWGSLSRQAAKRGADVFGITLSTEQLAKAQACAQDEGLSERCQYGLVDYRDLGASPQGSFDAVVSIEMIEAVGRAYWPTYFKTVHDQLKPGGLACIQTIVIDDALFDDYARTPDFIQRYVFPGGMLPSPTEFVQQAQAAGLQVLATFDFGGDYALTLERWRAAFLAKLAHLPALGFDERFVRLWDMYLAYCIAAFRTGNTSVVQYTLQKA